MKAIIPSDFMFQLTKEEANSLRFQIGMSKTSGRGGCQVSSLRQAKRKKIGFLQEKEMIVRF